MLAIVVTTTSTLLSEGSTRAERVVVPTKGLPRDLFLRPAETHPLVFPWGASYKTILREWQGGARAARVRAGKVKISGSRSGRSLRVRQGPLEYRYSFVHARQVRLVRSTPRGPEVLYAPVGGPGSGRLVAVSIVVPPIPFYGSREVELTAALERIYGKAVNRHRAYFDLENRTTSVRVFLEEHQGRRYVTRFSLLGRKQASTARKQEERLRQQVQQLLERKRRPRGSKTPRASAKPGPAVLVKTRPIKDSAERLFQFGSSGKRVIVPTGNGRTRLIVSDPTRK